MGAVGRYTMKSRREMLDEVYKEWSGKTPKIEWVKESDLPKREKAPIHFVFVGEEKNGP